ncbi:MAG: hypothetical protein IJ193_01875, partial [Bacilli bacterium]|nr:hypothetical protein [Bacilli bacterium]
MKKKKPIDTRRLTIKFLLCIVYFIVITILVTCSYKMKETKKEIPSWDSVESVNDYTYLEITKMSEKFAYYENENIGFHFIIEEKDTGEWHTYVIAIDEDEYEKYKDIIDYTYDRTKEVPDKIKVYGYPTIMNDELKELIVKNIKNFLPKENEVEIKLDNIEEYMTNSYLDTSKPEVVEKNNLLYATYALIGVMVLLVVLTIFDR